MTSTPDPWPSPQPTVEQRDAPPWVVPVAPGAVPPSSGGSRSFWLLRALVVVLVVATAAATVFAVDARRSRDDARLDAAAAQQAQDVLVQQVDAAKQETATVGLRQSATEAARAYAVDFTQYDYTTFDAQFDMLRADATPSFQKQIDTLRTALRTTLTSTMGKSTSTVRDVAVESLGRTNASVLVFVDQTNTNVALPEPRLDTYRLVIDLQQGNGGTGGWLVDDIRVV